MTKKISIQNSIDGRQQKNEGWTRGVKFKLTTRDSSHIRIKTTTCLLNYHFCNGPAFKRISLLRAQPAQTYSSEYIVCDTFNFNVLFRSFNFGIQRKNFHMNWKHFPPRANENIKKRSEQMKKNKCIKNKSIFLNHSLFENEHFNLSLFFGIPRLCNEIIIII